MIPFKPIGSNKIFGAPKGHEDEVQVLHTVESDGMQFSFWRPDEQELDALRNGGAVRLCVWGRSHPVVALDVTLEHADDLEDH